VLDQRQRRRLRGAKRGARAHALARRRPPLVGRNESGLAGAEPRRIAEAPRLARIGIVETGQIGRRRLGVAPAHAARLRDAARQLLAVLERWTQTACGPGRRLCECVRCREHGEGRADAGRRKKN